MHSEKRDSFSEVADSLDITRNMTTSWTSDIYHIGHDMRAKHYTGGVERPRDIGPDAAHSASTTSNATANRIRLFDRPPTGACKGRSHIDRER